MKVVDCTYCGQHTTNTGTKLCDSCWEVDTRIATFLISPNARVKVRKLLREIEGNEENK